MFHAAAAVIGAADPVRSRSAAAIADWTWMGQGWIGAMLLATVTSLPEHASGLSLMIASAGTIPALGPIGIPSVIVAELHVVGIRAIYVQERDGVAATAAVVAGGDMALATACRRYALAPVMIVLAGVALPIAGEAISRELGWNPIFVGTLLVAGAISLPELVAAVADVRIGSLNLAEAGILGSNMISMLILAVEDAVFLKGTLFDHVSAAHSVSSISAVIMTGLVIAWLQYRQTRKLGNTVGGISLALFLICLLNAYLTNLHGQ